MACSSTLHHGWTVPKESQNGIYHWALSLISKPSLFRRPLSSSGIPPGGQSDYVVPINSSGQWGTYWIHAHAGVSI